MLIQVLWLSCVEEWRSLHISLTWNPTQCIEHQLSKAKAVVLNLYCLWHILEYYFWWLTCSNRKLINSMWYTWYYIYGLLYSWIYYFTLIVFTVKKITKKSDCGQLTSLFLTLIGISDKFYMQFIDMYDVF